MLWDGQAAGLPMLLSKRHFLCATLIIIPYDGFSLPWKQVRSCFLIQMKIPVIFTIYGGLVQV